MNIYAIGDLHLSLFSPQEKQMDVFGDRWKNHWDKIKQDWINKVNNNDLVLIAGDISWAMKLSQAKTDLDAICDLPGSKIFVRGNHDYWWNSAAKIKNVLSENSYIIQNNSIEIDDYIICGTRGWIFPTDSSFTDTDEKIYQRELGRLKLSLDSIKDRKNKHLIVLMHYPPIYEDFKQTEFESLLSAYQVNDVIFGHLHGAILNSINLRDYTYNNIRYNLVSADYLDFKLKQII